MAFGTYSTVNGELFGCIFGTSLGEGVPCVLPTPKPAPPPSSSGSLYEVATQVFAAGDIARAQEIVNHALEFNTNDLQAAYLSRVFQRASQEPAGR